MKVSRKLILILLALAVASELMSGCGRKQETSQEKTKIAGENSSDNQEGESSADSADSVPDTYLITDENYFDYQPGLECSAFASAYVLRYFGEEANGLELFEDFPNKLPDGNGVYPSGVEQYWNDRKGYSAEFKTGGTVEELKRLVSTGVPVIVFVHVEEPYTTPHNTHYLPLVGYDETYFYFAESLDYLANCKDEPELGYNRKTEISKFERLWTNIDAAWDNPYFVIIKK